MKFIKTVFAAMLGFLIGLAVLCIIGVVIMMIAAAGFGSNSIDIDKQAVLHMNLNYSVMDRVSETGNSFNPFDTEKNMSLQQILKTIEKAKEDDRIKGIYLKSSGNSSGFAHLESIRNALLSFKESGKFITSYAENVGKKDYYLASVADDIVVNPKGFIEFIGFASERMFFKGLMEKLEIEPEIVWAGRFKSATEPFRLKEMSDANRKQVTEFINNFYSLYLNQIGKSINKTPEELRTIANEGVIQKPADALKYGLITKTLYDDQVVDLLKEHTGINKDDKLQMVSLKSYFESEVQGDAKSNKNKIAVVYAEGDIISGMDDENISSGQYMKLIRELRKDEDVKALVLRVNSGGGSALASEVIYHELDQMKSENEKPFVASMGNVAASGGYYILCHADSIFAQPNTLTGSIGVFSIIPNFQKFFNNKLGITFDRVKTGKYADIMNMNREMTQEERDIIQNSVDEVYNTFKQRCAEGRGMTMAEIDSIAQGRVWAGNDALQIGLIDRYGELDDAIKSAAVLANLDDYSVSYYPKEKNEIEKWMSTITSIQSEKALQKELGHFYAVLKQIQEVGSWDGVQARLPWTNVIE